MLSTVVIIIAAAVLVLVIMGVEIWRTPAGIERERMIGRGRFSSRTRTLTSAPPHEAIRLVQTAWSWWDRARAEPIRELGEGRTEFDFHPIRFLNLIEIPMVVRARLAPVEHLADGGGCIHATISGDFDARAEYSARPSSAGTVIEMAWMDAEVRGVVRFMPTASVAAIHCWRERIGVAALRRRLEAGR